MANLYISESSGMDFDRKGQILPVFNSDGPTQKVAFTTASQSAAFSGNTKIVRLYADAAFHLAFGANPTATASSPRFAASTEYFRVVQPTQKLSVYDGSS